MRLMSGLMFLLWIVSAAFTGLVIHQRLYEFVPIGAAMTLYCILKEKEYGDDRS